jgi:hypothetical protein
MGDEPGNAAINSILEAPILSDMAKAIDGAVESVKNKSLTPSAKAFRETTPALQIARGIAFRTLEPDAASREREARVRQIAKINRDKEKARRKQARKAENTPLFDLMEVIGVK